MRRVLWGANLYLMANDRPIVRASPQMIASAVFFNPACDGDTWEAPLRFYAWQLRSVFSRDSFRPIHNQYGYVLFAAFNSQPQLIFQGPLP